jgi:hypothetical protein
LFAPNPGEHQTGELLLSDLTNLLGEGMTTAPTHLMLLLLLLAVVVLFCILVGAAAALLARLDGATYTTAPMHGAVAFAGCATLSLAFLTFVIAAL